MIFKQFFERETSTFTYLLACEVTRQAVLIDTVISELDSYLTELQDKNLKLIYTLETHVHADHITAADLLRKRLGSKSIIYKDAGAKCGDILVTDNTQINVGSLHIEVRHTPGHTNGCVSYVIDNLVFTGDALLINGCGRTDFQMGDASQLFDSIHKKIFSLPDETLIYPGHDYNGKTVTTVGIEKQFNKRIGQKIGKEDFIKIMSNLKLDYPKQIEIALPANLECGLTPVTKNS